MFEVIKNKYILMVHFGILLFFCILFFLPFKNGFLLYGDFSTAFSYSKFYFFNIASFCWSSSSFLGYETLFYVLLRIPFYFFSDVINLLFNYNNYWIFFIIIYFLRYYFFYKLLKYFGVREFFSILVALLYSINFYFLDRFCHVLISFASITIPMFIISYFELSKKISIRYLSFFCLSFFIIASSMHVLLMTMYFFFILFVFLLMEERGKKSAFNFFKRNLMILFFFLSVFAYLIIPIFYSKFIIKSVDVIDQVAKQSSTLIYNLSETTLLKNSLSGTGYYASQLLEHEEIILVVLIFYIISIYIILFLGKKDDYRHNLFFISFLFFTFLSSVSLIYHFIPFLKYCLFGFEGVKDSSYFILYSQFSLFILLGMSTKQIKRENIKRLTMIFLSVFLCLLLFINIYAFKNFNYFKTTRIPYSYYELADRINKQERILILPIGWVTKFDWSNGMMSGFFNLFFADYEIVGQNIIEGPSKNTQDYINNFTRCFINRCPDLERYIKEIGIKKILDFHNAKDIDLSLESNKPLDYHLQMNYLIKKGLFKEYYRNSDYSAYEITDKIYINPKIDSNNIWFKKINPVKYKIYIANIKNVQDLSFLESFHEEWNLYLNKNPNKSWCDEFLEYGGTNKVVECKYTRSLFEGEELSYLYKKSIFSDTHKLALDYANQWKIDPVNIKKNFDKSFYKENSDGSINIELTLYYKPQSFFYLGTFISIFALLSYLFYFSCKFVKDVIDK